MSYSFRIYNKNSKSEFLLGILDKKNNEVINKINSILEFRNCVNECVPVDNKCKLAFINYNSLKFFLFGLCEFTLEDLTVLDKLGYKIQRLNLGVFSSGLSKMYTSYYDDEVDECEELSFMELFTSDKDMQYKNIAQPFISSDDTKYYKSRYGKFAKMNFSV